MLTSLGMSFTDMKRTDIRNPFAVEIVGLDNYVKLVEDPLFRKVTLNTLLYLLLGVPAHHGASPWPWPSASTGSTASRASSGSATTSRS